MDQDRLAGVRVLVVEDTADARDLFREILTWCGALVAVAASAKEAITILVSLRPHVVVSDIAMPDDGVALLRAVQDFADQHGLRVPVIAVTAHGGEFMNQYRNAGFVRHLLKPIDPNTLCAAVRQAKDDHDSE
jgi:CheY-like chemotaxis protein